MSNANFNKWLKRQKIHTDATTKKYVLDRPNGERTVIRYPYLEALCTKYFGDKFPIAMKKLLDGEAVITQDGKFVIEILDEINAF